jgi:hypothetical protein
MNTTTLLILILILINAMLFITLFRYIRNLYNYIDILENKIMFISNDIEKNHKLSIRNKKDIDDLWNSLDNQSNLLHIYSKK